MPQSMPESRIPEPERDLFCEECGTRASARSAFCDECGSPVGDKRAANTAATAVNTSSPAETTLPLASAQSLEATSTTPSQSRIPQGLSGTGLALLLLSLMLPWMQVSCGVVRVDIEGHRLLLGTAHEKLASLEANQANPRGASNQESPNLYLILWAAVVVLGGLVGAGSPSSDGKTVAVVGAGLGAVFLLIFYSTTNQDIQKAMAQSMGMVAFQWSFGFWLAVLATGLVGAGGVLSLMDSS